MQKILFLITKSNFGGAQRYVYDLATSLPKNQFETMVATGGNGSLINKLADTKTKTISIPSLQRDISLIKEFDSFSYLLNLFRAEKPDVIHINSSKAGLLGSVAGRLTRVPKIIFTAHGWAFNEDRPFCQRFIIKTFHWITVLLSHKTVAVSHKVKQQMDWPFVKNKMVVIYNGRKNINFETRDAAREFLVTKEPRLNAHKNDFWSMTIAELHPIKRHDAIIEAIKSVVKEEPETRHLIISNGEEKANLQKLIEDLDLQDNVFLLGEIDEAACYLKAADIFIMASRSEAMPYAPIEACLAGVPTVSTAVGGVPEIIEDNESGLLTPPLDNKALYKAILKLRTDSTLRDELAKGALLRAKEFAFDKTLAETIKEYSNKN